MADYLLIESRDPFESRGFAQRCELALALRADGAGVTLFLVENGVFAARQAAKLRELEKLAKAGVHVCADEFALRERGVGGNELAPTVESAPLEALVGSLASGAKALWH
jgi:sulfur relay (sulfurtransferase) complex TusBCD TusD component (DsrE family)